MAAAREPLPGAAQPLSGAASCPVSLSTRPAALGCSLGVPGRHQEAALCAFWGLRFCVRVVHPSISLVDHSLVVMIRDLLEILFPAKRTHPRLDGTVPAGGSWILEPRGARAASGNRGTRPYRRTAIAIAIPLALRLPSAIDHLHGCIRVDRCTLARTGFSCVSNPPPPLVWLGNVCRGPAGSPL